MSAPQPAVAPPPPAVAALERAAAVSRTRLDGRHTVWRTWGDARGDARGEAQGEAGGERPPLVMLHGGFGSWTHFLRVIPRLAESRRVICPDMPGYGDSDDPPEGDVLQALAAALASGLRDLLGPGAPVDIVGFSFGTVVAGALCARLAGSEGMPRPRRLVLLGPSGIGLPFNAVEGLMSLREGMDRDARREVHRNNLGRVMLSRPALVDDEAVLMQERNVAATRTRGRRYAQSDALCLALAERPVEALATVWGEHDAYVRGLEGYTERLESLYPAVTLRMIAEAGHWLPHEAPEATAAFIEGFLDDANGNRETAA